MHRRLLVRAGTSVLCALGVRVTTERRGPARFAEPSKAPAPALPLPGPAATPTQVRSHQLPCRPTVELNQSWNWHPFPTSGRPSPTGSLRPAEVELARGEGAAVSMGRGELMSSSPTPTRAAPLYRGRESGRHVGSAQGWTPTALLEHPGRDSSRGGPGSSWGPEDNLLRSGRPLPGRLPTASKAPTVRVRRASLWLLVAAVAQSLHSAGHRAAAAPARCPSEQSPCLGWVLELLEVTLDMSRRSTPSSLPLLGFPPRLLLITSLGAAFLLQASSAWTPQVLVQTKGKAGAEQGTEEAWGARAVEPLEEDSQLTWLFMAPKLLAATGEKRQGAEALAETEDTLGRVPSPRWGPEPDYDSLHHSWPEEAQGEARPWARVLPPQQVLQGPEEDRDHIYHPKEDPWDS
ncbi:PREDICTED: uncharacterized protein LOC103069168 [Lipotes vexillifer]|uniref:Uncharacterized protein LOC103069168 n=1 Tax=Lipotes vexillifer TaxID=118797 RepID=A0A340WY93_LIPVE|nr:PREDICTED: uncharacterized protein LOC103069168 [Lipotes vexillifer]